MGEIMTSEINKRILVLGDWVVDENFLVTIDSAPLKSYEGVGDQRYYSRKTKVNSQILSLCAAGGLTRMLHSLNDTSAHIDIFGLGCWEPGDTKYLATLCRQDRCLINQTPLTLKAMMDKIDDSDVTPKGISLCRDNNKSSCLECNECCKRLFSLSEMDKGTWRVQRIYNHIGTNPPQLIRRYDWEIPKPIIPEGLKTIDKLNKIINEIGQIDVVVVVDHQKGSVNTEIISAVFNHEKTAKADWFIRTKNYSRSSEWISIISKKIKLLFLGPMNVELDNAPWFLGKDLSREALQWLKNKSITNTQDKYSVVVFHENNKLAAFLQPERRYNSENNLYTTSTVPSQTSYTIGRATVLFASLVACHEKLLPKENIIDHIKTPRDALSDALNRSYHWCKLHETDLNDMPFFDDKETNFKKHFYNILRESPKKYGFQVEESDLDRELSLWDNALKNNGTLPPSSDHTALDNKFQIWRGWSVVEGYIAVIDEHKRVVSELVQAVKDFRDDPNVKRSLSSIITALPGNGKSYLIEMMSKQLDMEYREFNIAQLASIEQLIDCFDDISSLQTQVLSRPLIVFWDEINAKISNQEVYSYFLGPIWNGVYRRGGRSFQLKPCVWIFAGTEKIGHEHDKGSDFISRINGPNIDMKKIKKIPDISSQNDDQFIIEQLYISVALLKRNHLNLMRVSAGVLEFFKKLKPLSGIRSIDFIVSKIKTIDRGKLNINGLPDVDEIKSFVDGSNAQLLQQIINSYKKEGDNTFYRIYERPPD